MDRNKLISGLKYAVSISQVNKYWENEQQILGLLM